MPSMTKGPPWRECRGVSAATIMPARGLAGGLVVVVGAAHGLDDDGLAELQGAAGLAALRVVGPE